MVKWNKSKFRRIRTLNKRKSNWKIGTLILIGIIFIAGIYHLDGKKSVGSINDIPGWSWVLGGKTILIDAGHGGVDPGAVGTQKTLEKDINLEIAKRVQILFAQAGSKVVMLREDDRDFGTSNKLMQRKREDLTYRIQMAMETQADIYLSIHANSFPDQRQHGPQVFYHPNSEEGRLLAESIQQSLNKVGPRKREAKSNQTYFILKNTDMIAVTIEVGFLSNAEEEINLTKPEYQQRLAMAIFTGVGDYLTQEKAVVSDD